MSRSPMKELTKPLHSKRKIIIYFQHVFIHWKKYIIAAEMAKTFEDFIDRRIYYICIYMYTYNKFA